MRKIGLGQLTVVGVRPAELVEIAARAGYDAISPFLAVSGTGGLSAVPLKAGDPDTVAMARRMADTGVSINVGDGLVLHEGVPMEAMRAAIGLMGELGARGLNMVQFDPDASRAFDNFCLFREWAIDAGLLLTIEFTPLSHIATLEEALDWRKRAGEKGVAVMFDLMHLYRSGGSVEDLATLDPALIGAVQLCDGLRNVTPEDYYDQAIYERMVPGEGELHAREFLSMIPKDLIVDIEVPLRSREQVGESHEGRAAMLARATRALLDDKAGSSD